ncbi:MAG TPA: TOMM propeptide domain-containing protein [Chryseobacterium sp.]|uniref:class IIb bacteriocin, lactobin A/cerein 7B family n=1 Tax=Chryseobacterium lactis TaxID=1241981 RepID=UPI000EDB04C9|nr:class IIb bacteriocin, lactobin A/cerein 7B family [Chryseobacterium lactis]HCN50559.1 TOMM propeptide domain-containing protein [Chryseobacterium sp.]
MKLANEQQLNIINELITKSTNDAKFKAEFINNPKKIIEDSYQFKVYDNVKLVVEDQSDENIVYINIPRRPDLNEVELTDEELEKVAGGGTPAVILLGVAACAVYDFGCGVIDGIRNS